MPFLIIPHILSLTGVYLSRNGMLQANNSALFISDISNTVNTRLQCITDTVSCCTTDPAGEWFFPDGGMVPIQNMSTTFYRNRGDDGTVNLNRLNDVMMPTGRFCCVVPDATGVSQWACAVICELVYNDFNTIIIIMSSFY